MSLTKETHKPCIAIDVDGVIADYSEGFQGPAVIGNPLPGAKEFLEKLRGAGWKVIIYTTRGTEVMKEYMARHGLYYDEINDNSDLRGENPGKPIATVYLDDRAVRFKGNFDKAFEEVTSFTVWYERVIEIKKIEGIMKEAFYQRFAGKIIAEVDTRFNVKGAPSVDEIKITEPIEDCTDEHEVLQMLNIVMDLLEERLDGRSFFLRKGPTLLPTGVSIYLRVLVYPARNK